MKGKLNDNYGNSFITTIKGLVFTKDKETEVDLKDVEVANLVNQGIIQLIPEHKDRKVSKE